MSRMLRKSRFLYLHPETNPGKVERLDALHREYVTYVRICVRAMFDGRRLSLSLAEKSAFFPSANLLSHVRKNAQDHAIAIVSTWAKSRYVLRLKGLISKARKAGEVLEDSAKALYTIGKYLRDKPGKGVEQEDLDLYWKLLHEKGGRKPEVPESLPMRFSEVTARLAETFETEIGDFWLRVSSLEYRKPIWLPLVGNPYVTKADQVVKGILARRTKKGTWRFEALETKEWIVPEPSDLPPDAPRLGIDVGLNVLAATSDGDLYGKEFKPKFDRLYKKVRDLRANRQRQGLPTNSPRLDALESRLSGSIKTETGRISNLLVTRNPGTVFVLEDLDLSGCRGQKRFAYRALSKAIASKAPTEEVNPAYTSQECPSCGYLSRSNRSGTQFRCRFCGRKAHADWVGASGVLRRSQDKDIGRDDHPRTVGTTLRRRFRLRRNSPVRSFQDAPVPSGRSLTIGVPPFGDGTGKGSNLVLT